jgi:hypothetical protein
MADPGDRDGRNAIVRLCPTALLFPCDAATWHQRDPFSRRGASHIAAPRLHQLCGGHRTLRLLARLSSRSSANALTIACSQMEAFHADGGVAVNKEELRSCVRSSPSGRRFACKSDSAALLALPGLPITGLCRAGRGPTLSPDRRFSESSSVTAPFSSLTWSRTCLHVTTSLSVTRLAHPPCADLMDIEACRLPTSRPPGCGASQAAQTETRPSATRHSTHEQRRSRPGRGSRFASQSLRHPGEMRTSVGDRAFRSASGALCADIVLERDLGAVVGTAVGIEDPMLRHGRPIQPMRRRS